MVKKLAILSYPNNILREKAKKVKNPIDPEIKKLIAQMELTMKEAGGLGLAAPQIGKSLQICLVGYEEKLYVLINPKIAAKSKKISVCEEGCLSFPGKFYFIKRPDEVKIRCLDENGISIKIKANGILARAFQHEIDHLNGILFVDKIKNK